MEKLQFERREKIAAALFVAAAGVTAYTNRKEGKTGIARLYPGGTLFADIVRDVKEGALTRFAFLVKNNDPLEFDFDGVEHTKEELDEVSEAFDLDDNQDNPLQNA